MSEQSGQDCYAMFIAAAANDQRHSRLTGQTGVSGLPRATTRQRDANPRPLSCKSDALPIELQRAANRGLYILKFIYRNIKSHFETTLEPYCVCKNTSIGNAPEPV